MKDFLLLNELKAVLTNKKILVPIIAIIMIPILYAGMFLWAFWNPYDYMADLPVAIVNTDEGATYEGEQLELGNELVSNLKDNPEFDFHFVDEETGIQDLHDEKYYVLIKIPTDFSNNATTLLDDSPEKLNLIYLPNESFNFLSAQMGETAMLQIEAALEENIIETYAETMFDKVEDMSDGFETASTGAFKLYDGSFQLHDGAEELDTGANTLENGAIELKDNLKVLAEKSVAFNSGTTEIQDGSIVLSNGINDLAKGVKQLNEGQNELLAGANASKDGAEQIASGVSQTKTALAEVNSNAGKLYDGSSQIKTGSNQLSSSLQSWVDGADQTSTGAKNVNQGIQSLEKQLNQLLANTTDFPEETSAALKATLAQLNTGSKQVADGTQELSSSAKQLKGGADALAVSVGELNNGQKALKDGVNRLHESSIELDNGASSLVTGQNKLVSGLTLFSEKLTDAKDGVYQLATGANSLAEGTNKLVDGSAAFMDGTNQLSKGSTKLADGTSELVNGTRTLSDGTSDMLSGAGELSDKLADASEETSSVTASSKTYEMMSNPAEVKTSVVNEVPNYGTGFAPYFLSLGLFVGALLLSIVYPLREPAGIPKNGYSWFLSKFIVLLSVGIFQALIASGILLFGLGLEVQSIPLFVLFSIITSLTFITLIQFLVTCFGDPGRFVAIIILILQLTTSAGTFPLELIPKTLQFFNTFLPMTYSVQGFKAVISSGNYSAMWQNVGILLGFTTLFMIGGLSYFLVMFKRKFQVFSNDEAVKE